MDNTIKPPTVLSICSGYGGVERGLERVFREINILAHVEIEAFAIANLVNKMETGQMVPTPVWTDIKTFRAGLFRGNVDILTGGYPCQPFSIAGKRLGTKDPRHLWPYIRETIKACEPRLVFLENVEGHLSRGVVQVLSDLEKMAYIPKCGVFSAAEVGAPHQRKRVFILAYSENANRWPAKEGLYNETVRESGTRRIGAAGFTLANTRNPELNRIPESEERREDRAAWNSSFELADTGCIGSKQPWAEQPAQPNRDAEKWPSRPGEPQHEWEEPRTVADTNQYEQSETQSQLGGAVDGTTDRVDRLRLLGNGVVPQTAEKAFRTLYREIINGQ